MKSCSYRENSKKELEKTMSLRKNLFGVTGIILTFGMVAFAQQPQPPTTTQDGTLKRDRLEQRRERLRERTGGMRLERREKLRERLDGMRQRHGGPEGFRRGGHVPGDFAPGVQLSDEQRQQARAIMQRRLEGTKTQREELFKLREKRIAGTFNAEDEARAKALHQEIRSGMEGARTEVQGVLTAEQKTQIEEFQKQRKARREQRMKEHEIKMKEHQDLRSKPL
jgi:Spy/CpxP family protein refolding chaperone